MEVAAVTVVEVGKREPLGSFDFRSFAERWNRVGLDTYSQVDNALVPSQLV